MQNIRNRQNCLQLNHRSNKQQVNTSIKLGSVKRQKRSFYTPGSKATLANSSSILSSVSRRLQPQSISTISRGQQSQSVIDKVSVSVTCMADFDTVSLMSLISEKVQINFKQVLLNVHDQDIPSLINSVHPPTKSHRICVSSSCSIKTRWLQSIVFYSRQVKNLMLLKQRLHSLPPSTLQQINKDIARSFPSQMFPKTRLTLYHACSEKLNMLECLKTTLSLYAVYDPAVGYIQGVNLITAAIVLHVKQPDAGFIILKELMWYGRLRDLYVDEFALLKKQGQRFFQVHLKSQIFQLYQHFQYQGVEPLTLVTPYYTCLFASVVDIAYMHIVVDQYFRQGVGFLHRLFLALLLFLKQELLQAAQETIVRLGCTHLKTRQIPWDQVIEATQYFRDI